VISGRSFKRILTRIAISHAGFGALFTLVPLAVQFACEKLLTRDVPSPIKPQGDFDRDTKSLDFLRSMT